MIIYVKKWIDGDYDSFEIIFGGKRKTNLFLNNNCKSSSFQQTHHFRGHNI